MSGGTSNVRDASECDAEACAAIYAPYVTDTAITFENDPPLPAEMAERIAPRHAHTRVGRAREPGPRRGLRLRRSIQIACGVSLVMRGQRLPRARRRRTGGGRALYDALFDRLAVRGFRTAVAGMTLPDDASVGLHRAMGFEPVGTYRRNGWKHGTWHDVAWVQRTIATGQGPPTELR